MPIPLDTPGTGGPPAVKFGQIGDYVTVGIADVRDVPSKDYDTGEPEFWPNGDPKMHPRVTGIVIDAQGATVGKDEDERPVEVGELVSLYMQGARFFAWRDAKKAHGVVDAGDVMRWRFAREDKPRNPRHKDIRVFVAELRKPTGKDGDLLERCEAAYYQLRDRVTVDAVTPAPAAPYDPDSEPF